jgi:hypothetical protein
MGSEGPTERGGRRQVKRSQLYITLFWILLGIFVSAYSFRLGLGRLLSPGPGLMPFGLGATILVLALYKLVAEFLQTGKEKGKAVDGLQRAEASFQGEAPAVKGKEWLPAKAGKLVLLTAILLAYALFFETLGYLITTFVAMALLLRTTGYRKWTLIIIYSVLIVGATYSLFTYLGVRFPSGILGSIGLG